MLNLTKKICQVQDIASSIAMGILKHGSSVIMNLEFRYHLEQPTTISFILRSMERNMQIQYVLLKRVGQVLTTPLEA